MRKGVRGGQRGGKGGVVECFCLWWHSIDFHCYSCHNSYADGDNCDERKDRMNLVHFIYDSIFQSLVSIFLFFAIIHFLPPLFLTSQKKFEHFFSYYLFLPFFLHFFSLHFRF